MRPLLQFLGFCIIVFFVVGEFQGWYVGFAPNTPMFVYKMDRVVTVRRDVNYDSEMPFKLDGRVRNGEVRVQAFFEVPPSFQRGTSGSQPRQIFDQEFSAGQTIRLNESLRGGQGRYTIRMTYTEATGLFRLDVPQERVF